MKKMVAAASIGLFATAVQAGVDNISKLIDKSVALSAPSGSPLLQGATVVDATSSSPAITYTTSNNAGGGFQTITGIGSGATGAQTVTASDLQLFYAGDPNNSVSQPLAGTILLNPDTLNFGTFTAAPGTIAIISDSEQTKSGTTLDPANTKRLYFWNLYQSGAGHDPILTPIMTRAAYNTAAGVSGAATTANDNMGLHQFAFSSDGQSVYFTDSTGGANGLGGVYRTNIVSGTTTRLETERSSGTGAHDIMAEPGVMSVNGVDRVMFDGSTALGNVGGINYFDDNGSATPTVQSLLSGTTLQSFLNTTDVMTVGSVIADSSGNIYFSVTGGSTTTGTRRAGLFRLDPENRLSKVVSFNEEVSYFTSNGFGTPVAGVTHMGMHTTASDLPQIDFVEKGTSSISAITSYLPGDFNRDGVVNQADVAMFDNTSVLRPRGVTTSNADNFKFDMNGDANQNASSTVTPTAIVDYADVKVFQQFYGFANGDANMDGTVNALDFNALATNYGGASDVWVQGDFNGDNTVNSMDFDILARNFGLTTPLGDGIAADEELSSAALGSIVPEPASLVMLPLAGLLLQRRTRRSGTGR